MAIKREKDSEEARFVKLAKKGDHSAFAALLKLHKEKLYRYCYYLTKNSALAEDICQDTFIKAFKSIDQLESSGSLSSWLHSIAMRLFLDYRKPQKNKDHDSFEDSPEQSTTKNLVDLKDTINDVFEHLHDEEKNAILLVDLAQNSYEDAAVIMNISLESFKWRIREARRKFISYFEDNKIEVTGIFTLPKKDSA